MTDTQRPEDIDAEFNRLYEQVATLTARLEQAYAQRDDNWRRLCEANTRLEQAEGRTEEMLLAEVERRVQAALATGEPWRDDLDTGTRPLPESMKEGNK